MLPSEIQFTIGVCLFLFILFCVLITDKRTDDERLAEMKREADRKKLENLKR